MKAFFRNNHRGIFYFSWVLLGLIQSRFTELLDDEAYYWVYSKFPAWGYFDHPPLIAILVKWGYSIFQNELGVRLFPLAMNILTLMVMEKLLPSKNSLLFYVIAFSVAILQLTGFTAVPDIPLIFFTALFFLSYRRFLAANHWLNVALLGLCIALLLYSKYQAALIILFTLLSNLRLFKDPRAWIAVGVAFVLYMPHLNWQYEHDWISFRYHLFESNAHPYNVSFTLDYLLGQVLLPGPLAGFILLPAAFLYRPKNGIERAMYFTMAGIYGFFLLSSLRGRVEANWTAPALVPVIILSHQFLHENAHPFAGRLRRILYRLLPVTLGIVVFARVIMMFDLLPLTFIKQRYFGWKDWPMEVREKTGGTPVVFGSSYQMASKYWFYSGTMAHSQSWFWKRKSNFDFWPTEDSLLGKPVYFLSVSGRDPVPGALQTPLGWISYRYDSSFTSYTKLKLIPSADNIHIRAGEPIVVDCSASMPAHYKEFILTRDSSMDSTFAVLFDKWARPVYQIYLPVTLKEITDSSRVRLVIDPKAPKGNYELMFSIKHGDDMGTHNSKKIPVKIE